MERANRCARSFVYQSRFGDVSLPRGGEQQRRSLEQRGNHTAIRNRAGVLADVVVPFDLPADPGACGADAGASAAAAIDEATKRSLRRTAGGADADCAGTARHAAAGISER